MKKFLFLFLLIFLFWSCGDSSSSTADTDVCKNITCGEHGSCVTLKSKPACVCDEGFKNVTVGGVPTCLEDTVDNKCGDTTCETWQECKEDTCVTKEGYCAIDEECNEQVCDMLTHTCKDEEVDPCEGIDCSGHGNCIPSGSNAICICEEGYRAEGTACVEINEENPCEGIDCSGHGNCIPSGSNAICICDTGYTAVGTTCVEDNTDPCEGVVCENDWEECNEGECKAKEGFCSSNGDCLGNKYCDETDHTCKSPANPCDGINCNDGNNEELSHGQCVVSNGQPLCICSNGYEVTDNGINCVLVDPCANIVCGNDWEECVEGECKAKEGFCSTNGDCLGNKYCDETDHTCKEDQGSTVCEGIVCGDGTSDESHGICFDANGVATCSCNQGYYRPSDNPATCLPMENLCADITCSGHGTCAVVDEQPVCACDEGYLVEGLNCIEDKCYNVDCSGHGTCVVVNDAAQCNCDEGYKEDGLTCQSRCWGDSDCEDGLYCNGVETCGQDGFCKAGTPVDCHQNDEEYACLAAAYCDEGSDSCVYELPDSDDDGFFDMNCSLPSGIHGEDCNDSNEDVNPDTPETCNYIDDNCNTVVDEGFIYANGSDVRITRDDADSGCSVHNTAEQCGNPNYSILWNNDEFAVAWVDYRTGSDQIFFARYNADGTLKTTSEFQITNSTNTTAKKIFPQSLARANNKYVLLWVENGKDVKRVFFNGNGVKLSTPTLLHATTPRSGHATINTAVIWDGTNFTASWVTTYWSNSYPYFYTIKFNYDGQNVTERKRIRGAYGHGWGSSILIRDDSGIFRELVYDASGNKLLLYNIKSDSTIEFVKNLSITNMYDTNYTVGAGKFSLHRKVENGGTVNYFLAYLTTDKKIYIVRYDSDFNEISPRTLVSDWSNNSYPSMVWTGNQYIISFSADPDGDNTYDVYVARVDAYGNVTQTADKASNGSSTRHSYPTLIDRDKKFSLFFLGYESGRWELYTDTITCPSSGN